MTLCNLLRVSLVFIIDELFQSNFGLTELTGAVFPVNNISTNGSLSQNVISESLPYFKAIFLSLLKFIVSGLILCATLCLFVLPEKYLYLVYFHIVSICVVLLSYWANVQSLNVLLGMYDNIETDFMFEVMTLDFNRIVNLSAQLQVVDFVFIFFRNIILQFFLSLVFDFLQDFTTNNPVHKIFRLSFIIPTLIVLVPGTHGFLNTIALLATLWPLFVNFKTLWLNIFTVTNLIRGGYNHISQTIYVNGINNLFQVEWNRLNIPTVLRLFWAFRVMEQILYLLTDIEIINETVYGVIKILLIKGCDTCIAVLGMTSFFSYFSYYIGNFFQWVLLSDNVDGDKIKTLSVVFFYMLALQTKLTSLEPDKRFIRLNQNVCLVCAAQLYYIHNGVDMLLKSLSTSRNPSFNKHIRALIVCVFLILFPTTMMKYLWTHNSISSWLLVVSSFYIEIIIRVLLSLAVYSLFLIDAHRQTFWEKLEDYVYYITLFGNMVKYCFGLFVFLDSVYNLLFISVSVYRVIMMSIHAYLKIWCVARDGWTIFNKRRIVVKKVDLLPEATSNQLANLDDVCSICHHNMVSAKITQCNHFFHGVCLRKWLHLKDRCPLCHADL